MRFIFIGSLSDSNNNRLWIETWITAVIKANSSIHFPASAKHRPEKSEKYASSILILINAFLIVLDRTRDRGVPFERTQQCLTPQLNATSVFLRNDRYFSPARRSAKFSDAIYTPKARASAALRSIYRHRCGVVRQLAPAKLAVSSLLRFIFGRPFPSAGPHCILLGSIGFHAYG